MSPRDDHAVPLLATVALLALLPTNPLAAQEPLDWEAIADRLVAQIDPQPGERVLLVALPGRFDALVPILRRKLGATGAVDLGAIATQSPQPASWKTEFTSSLRGRGEQELVAALADVDVTDLADEIRPCAALLSSPIAFAPKVADTPPQMDQTPERTFLYCSHLRSR